MVKGVRIAFVGDVHSSFTQHDCDILSQFFDVHMISLPKKMGQWFTLAIQLVREVRRCDLSFCWFASPFSAFTVLLSRVFNKKSVVVVGGYDAAYLPEFSYGAFTNLKEKIPAVYIYKHADKILVVNQALKDEIIKNAHVSGETIEFLPTGFDPKFWKPNGTKENLVITVAGANTILRVKIKGLETFVGAAADCPNTRFLLISVTDLAKEYLKKLAPNNVEFAGYLSQHEILSYYQKAKVYCQLSLREGLPTALCEAMLCECIPVGSEAIGVQSVIGDTGFSVKYGDSKQAATMIQRALASGDEQGKNARERIISLFHEEKKKQRLQQVILEIVSKK